MKDTDITISFNSEKLDALNFYMSKKDSDVQGELEETMQGLYMKHVPAPTREYIEDRLEREGNPTSTIPKASKKPIPSVKNQKKDKKNKASQTSEPKADAIEESAEVTDSIEEKMEEPSTQDKVDELVNGTSDGSDSSDSGNSSGDGFLDGLLN